MHHLIRTTGALALIGVTGGGCAQIASNTQGPLQPQAQTGPCQVGRFFLLAQTAVHTTLAISPSGQACSFVVINPDLQAFPTASIITRPPEHGQATTGIVNGGVSVGVSYAPQPNYTGPDRFTVTIEPNDHAIDVAVTVR